MFRKDLVELLRDKPLGVSELAKMLGVSPREMDDNLKHLAKTLKRSKFALSVEPARCRKCGFTFAADRFIKPGKCPRCHATWIREPLLQTRERDGR